MTSVTEVANKALLEIGQDPITDLNEGSSEANKVLIIFDSVVTEVTQSKYWRSAITRVELAVLTEKPLYGFNFQFQLPPDNLDVIEINETPTTGVRYNIEDGKLLFDDSTIKIAYIRKQDNPTLWGSRLERAIVLRLAAGISYTIVRNVQLTESLYNAYNNWSRTASSKDSKQGSRKYYSSTRTTRFR